jgi:hypothetical protein
VDSIFQAIDELLCSWCTSSSMETFVILDFVIAKIKIFCSTSRFGKVGVGVWQSWEDNPKQPPSHLESVWKSSPSILVQNSLWLRRNFILKFCDLTIRRDLHSTHGWRMNSATAKFSVPIVYSRPDTVRPEQVHIHDEADGKNFKNLRTRHE